MAAKIGGLGRGLDSLFAENAVEERASAIAIRITEIEPNKGQPRKQFDETALAELAASVAQHGVLQPLLVRPLPNGQYQLVAGERRWRAARMAGLQEVPAVVREMSEQEAAELALIENLQRQDLNPMEEAQGYRTLMESYGLTQEETAKAVNKSRPAVANALRLLSLPGSLTSLVESGELSAGHARALLSFETKEQQEAAAKAVLSQGLSVRALENMAKKARTPRRERAHTRRDTFFDEVELALSEHLGRKIKVSAKENVGVLEIEFYGKEDLTVLANLLVPKN